MSSSAFREYQRVPEDLSFSSEEEFAFKRSSLSQGETEENMDKPLSAFGLGDGGVLSCDDFLQNYTLRVWNGLGKGGLICDNRKLYDHVFLCQMIVVLKWHDNSMIIA